MLHFDTKAKRTATVRTVLREGVYPLWMLLVITGILVAVFAVFITSGASMTPVIPPHMDDGEEVDPNPLRLAFMCLAFLAAFVFAEIARRKGRQGRTLAAFLYGYTGGTLLWQSVGECAWHFSIVGEDYLMCFPHLEGASAIPLVILSTALILYCWKRKAFEWGIWAFALSFIGNWFGHFLLIGTYPLVHTVMEEHQWFILSGLVLGILTILASLYLAFFSARTQKARLCCCLMLYFGIGMIVTGVGGI